MNYLNNFHKNINFHSKYNLLLIFILFLIKAMKVLALSLIFLLYLTTPFLSKTWIFFRHSLTFWLMFLQKELGIYELTIKLNCTQGFSFFSWHGSSRIHVQLIPNKHAGNFLIDTFVHFIIPHRHIFKTFPVCKIIHNDYSICSPVVSICNGSKSLLACSIPLSYE